MIHYENIGVSVSSYIPPIEGDHCVTRLIGIVL
jgi:hypothetical protein